MIKNTLIALNNKGYKKVVYSEHCADVILTNIFKQENIHYVSDVRSATFFAFGKAKTQCSPVILLVDESYISSCYTALMEAWMQRIKIIIVAYNSRSYKNTLYLERCVDTVYEISNKDGVEEIAAQVGCSLGPILIKISECIAKCTSIDYADILPTILQQKPGEEILCYCPDKSPSDIKVIEERHKYGILSKYMGMLMSGTNYVLIIPDTILNLDSNIFNIRNLPCNFYVVIQRTSDNTLAQYQTWIESNGIEVKELSSPDEIMKHYNKSNPTIVVIG